MTQVIIAMGSKSDVDVMRNAATALETFAISHRCRILSAHRTPDEVAQFAKSARSNGVRVIIAGAGGAAHLPGMLAAFTTSKMPSFTMSIFSFLMSEATTLSRP